MRFGQSPSKFPVPESVAVMGLVASLAAKNSSARGGILLLLTEAPLKQEHAELIGLPEVLPFYHEATAFFQANPAMWRPFLERCQALWPEFFSAEDRMLRAVTTEEEDEDDFDSPVVERCRYVLRTRFLADLMAIRVGCLLITEESGKAEIRTSDLTSKLRLVGYKIQNAAPLLRSLADRPDPEIEILDQVGGRQELLFRLLPSALKDLRSRILVSPEIVAA